MSSVRGGGSGEARTRRDRLGVPGVTREGVPPWGWKENGWEPIAPRSPHDLRRSAVRNMERAGVPRSVAMKLSGHQTESIYRRYAIADKEAIREGVEKLADRHATDAERDDRGQVVPLDKAREA